MNVLLDYIKHWLSIYRVSGGHSFYAPVPPFHLGDGREGDDTIRNIFQTFVYPQSRYGVTKDRPSSVGI